MFCYQRSDLNSILTASLRFHSASSLSPPQILGCFSLRSPYRIQQTPRPPPTRQTQPLKLQRIVCKAGFKRAVRSVSLTRFMRSRRSVISRSRDWIILLMSLMRGPKFASSLSSLDFSCKQEIKQTKQNTLKPTITTQIPKRQNKRLGAYLHVE